MKYISVFAVPVMILLFVGWGLIKRVNVYDCFIDGAKDGISSLVGIIPNLIGLMVAISMFRNSGALELLEKVFSPLLEITKIPKEVLPLAFLRPISGSASTAIVADIFNSIGPDSMGGKIASVMMGSTETTFYTIAVYYGAVGIKRYRHTLPSALSADLTGIIMSVIITGIIL